MAAFFNVKTVAPQEGARIGKQGGCKTTGGATGMANTFIWWNRDLRP